MTTDPTETARDRLIAYAATTRTVTADGLAPFLDAFADEVRAQEPAVAAPATQAALREQIAALHEPIAGEGDTRWCSTCSQEDEQPQPVGWWVPWPCPTMQAVDAVLPADSGRADTLREAAEDHRLALSEALGLGTGAPWDAIHDRATELGLPPLDRDPVARRLGLLAEHRAKILNEAADAVFALDYDAMVGEEGDENLGSMREAWDLGTIHAMELLRRMAAEPAATTAADTGEAEVPSVCDGFVWIGQSFAICERCAQPAWDHVGEEVPVEGAGPFDNRRTVRPWAPGQADRIRAKWGTPVAGLPAGGTQHGEERPRCPRCQLPHDLTPESMGDRACQSILASLADAGRRHDAGDHSRCARVDCEVVRARAAEEQR